MMKNAKQQLKSCDIKPRSNIFTILICDDDKIFTSRLKKSVEDYTSNNKIRAKIHSFYSSEEIGTEVLSSCDIAFLDIDFEGKSYNGLDIARRLRRLKNDAVIVFITNYIEYAPEGYEVEAFRYILKDEIPKKLSSTFALIIERLKAVKCDIKIKVDGELIAIPVQNILYIESMDHTLIFHVERKGRDKENQYSCYSTLSEMETNLTDRGFLRIHKSFLVNMEHIKKLSCNDALLDNGVTLRVSSKTYSEIKKKYMLWKGKQ